MKINDKNPKHRQPSARTPNQKEYIKAIINKDIVVCEGAAGTGKTNIAIGMAITALRKGLVEKIVITRPLIESGEQMGFLPGDVNDKMDPYVRPVLNELESYASHSEIATLRNSGVLKIVPIAFMRGLTFNNAFIIVDEAQNITFDQMKMVLTRFGQDSKMVLTGDIEQSDLRRHHRGAFNFICDLFEKMELEETQVIHMEPCDNQRHRLVEKISQEWEKNVEIFQNNGKLQMEKLYPKAKNDFSYYS